MADNQANRAAQAFGAVGSVTRLCALVFISFIIGAGAYAYKLPPYRELRVAFIGADALVERYLRDDASHSFFWAPARRGDKEVTHHDAARAYQGVTLYLSTHDLEAVLVDMEGRPWHRWALDFSEAWPEPSHVDEPRSDDMIFWRAAKVLPNGDLLAVYIARGDTPWGYGLAKIDKDSRPIWTYAERMHHDLDVGPDGHIYGLGHRIEHQPLAGLKQIAPPYLEDFLVVLSPEGEELRRVSLLSALAASPYADLARLAVTAAGEGNDPLHTNAVELVRRPIDVGSTVLQPGQVIVCFRQINTIAAIDPVEGRVVWAYRGPWLAPHDPDLLANGRIMLFDNRGHFGAGGASRVVEFDPRDQTVTWTYSGTDAAPFFSALRGRQQVLPNGNVLITESAAGRLLEITRDGEIVWEYINPHRSGVNDAEVAWIMGGERYAISQLSFLRKTAVAQSPAGMAPLPGRAP